MEHIWEVLPVTALAGGLYLLGRALGRRGGGGPSGGWRREVVGLAMVCYAAALLALVWTPANLWSQLALWLRYGWPVTCWQDLFQGSYDWGFHLFDGAVSRGEWGWTMLAGNVLLYLPMGVLLPLRWPALGLRGSLAAGVCADLVIELVQPVFGRSFDLEDVFCNTLGIGAGLLLVGAARALCPGAVKKWQGVTRP